MFKEIAINEIDMKIFHKIDKEWMLITAGGETSCNTMTASWGQLGTLWSKPVATAYIRPQRYTKAFVDSHECFTLTFFNGKHYKELGVLGSKSGRDGDKISEVGFHTTMLDGVPAIEEGDLVLVVKKLYADVIKKECFFEKEIDEKQYSEKQDYHTMYIGEVLKAYVKA